MVRRSTPNFYPLGDRTGRGEESEFWSDGHARLEGFWIDAYSVTNRKYQEFLRANGRPSVKFLFPGGRVRPLASEVPELMRPLLPAIAIDWGEASAWLKGAGIAYFDPAIAMLADRERENRPFYFEYDQHWNVAGQASPGRNFARWMENQSWLPTAKAN